jgi:hypothetical protein
MQLDKQRLAVARAGDCAMADGANVALCGNSMCQARRSLVFARRAKKSRVGEGSEVAYIPLDNNDSGICMDERDGDVFDDKDVSDLFRAWQLREEHFSYIETHF